jgi:uncharacterized protein YbaP (TraB family)
MKRFILLIFFFPVFVFSQQSLRYPSLLWKISGNGLKKPSYLYGTMHVSNRVAYYLSDQFFDALKSVEVVGLETSPGEWMQGMEATGELTAVNQFNNSYSKDFYKSTFNVTFPDKRILQGILSYDPDIINGLLYRHNRTKENFEENTYIDLFIFQSASKLNKQVISLENFAQSEIMARLSALPDAETSEGGDEAISSKYYYNIQKIEDAYRSGNLDVLDSLSKLSNSKNTQKYLIDERNIYFVKTIDSVLKTKSIFSGVGAAHLPGDDGCIELLRKKGYTVEAVIPKITKKSASSKDALEALQKPVSFQKQMVADSAFTVSLPGKLQQIVNFENVKYYLYADMVNGNFYTVVRLKYLGPLFNITSSQMMQKIDSLFFEYIPGKIINKKEITSNNNLKGFEILNRTRGGDEQRYQIFFSDLEVFVFKLGGKQNYVSGGESKQFFNSINFRQHNDELKEFVPKTKGFLIRMPHNVSYVKNEGSSMMGIVEDAYAYSKTNNTFYGLKHAVNNDFDYLEEDTFELNRFSKHIFRNFNFKIDNKAVFKPEQGFPCMQLSSKNKAGANFRAKLFIKGVHYYLVYAVSPQEIDFENDYFKSFIITDFNYVNKIKEITDKDFFFKANDEVTDNAVSQFNEAYSKAYEKAVVKGKKENTFDYDFRTATKSYYSPSSNEYVNIIYEKYNDYDFRDKNEIERKIEEVFKKNYGLNIAKKQVTGAENNYSYYCTLKDTATARAIDVKLMFNHGLMHQISAPYDTTIGLTGWAKEFMETFKAIDTVIGKNIFENKFELLLSDLTNVDTVVRQRANLSLQNSVSMNKAFAPAFVKFIQSEKLKLVSENSRAQLFVNGGTINNENIIEPYKNLYKQYTDSFYLQLCLLKGLSYLKTQKSYNTFYDLIINETPLVGSESTVSDVISILHDSLELCKKFFPGMLLLTKYDEYKPSVYSLFAEMVNKKMISVNTFAVQKPGMLADANLALKRYNSSGSKIGTTPDYDSQYNNLDRSAKELAENLQNNLDGFHNNNAYKGSAYLRSVDVLNRPELVNYAIILMPLYKTDENVKQFINKLCRIKTQQITMPLNIVALKYGITLNDTIVSHYCKNKFTRAYFYTQLEKEKLTDKFDKEFLSQPQLVESVLYSQKQLAAIYAYDKDKNKKDSLILLKVTSAKNRYQSGKMYIYKTLKSKFDTQKLCVAFVPNSTRNVSSDIEVLTVNYEYDVMETEDENVNELLDSFSLKFRKRAYSLGSSTYYPQEYEY